MRLGFIPLFLMAQVFFNHSFIKRGIFVRNLIFFLHEPPFTPDSGWLRKLQIHFFWVLFVRFGNRLIYCYDASYIRIYR